MSNPFKKRLLKRADARFTEDRSDMSYTDWICANTTLRGRPFSVEEYPFQRKIIDDMHPNMDVIKCSQVGMTEAQVRKALAFVVRNRGLSAIFTLPNDKMYERVANARIKPLVDKDQAFNPEGEKNTRTKDQMQFGDSWLYVTGCKEGDATSIPSDAVFNDELDLSPQNMIALFKSRLQNSDYKIHQRFGTPTFPQFGVDTGFQLSDQHVYLVKCESCNHWNWPEFNRDFIHVPGLPEHIEHLTEIDAAVVDDIELEGAYVHCEKCGSGLDLKNPDLREWVARYPGRTHARGYHISPFTTHRLPPSYIITQLLEYKKNDYIRGFYNTVLGMPYSDGNIRLDRNVLLACFTANVTVPEISADQPVAIGIDMGQTCHITLGTADHTFLWETVHVDNLFAKVDELMQRYNIVAGAADRHPYEPTVQELTARTEGVIMPVEYRGTKEVNMVREVDGEISHAQVDRTKMIDQWVKVIKNGHKFSGYGSMKEVIIDHHRNMVRDEQPGEPAKWVKLNENDHFFHAAAFKNVAFKVKEVERILSKEDPRSIVSTSLSSFGKKPPNIAGRGNNSFTGGLFNV